MSKLRGQLDVKQYLEWYKHFVEEENAPQYIGRSMYRVNPVTIVHSEQDEEYGRMLLVQTADGAVNALVPSQYITVYKE